MTAKLVFQAFPLVPVPRVPCVVAARTFLLRRVAHQRPSHRSNRTTQQQWCRDTADGQSQRSSTTSSSSSGRGSVRPCGPVLLGATVSSNTGSRPETRSQASAARNNQFNNNELCCWLLVAAESPEAGPQFEEIVEQHRPAVVLAAMVWVIYYRENRFIGRILN